METYMIGYDLVHKPIAEYKELFKAIESLADKRGAWHCLDSTWLIKTDTGAAAIRDSLKIHLGKSDRLLVARLSGESAWAGFDEGCGNWLINNIASD